MGYNSLITLNKITRIMHHLDVDSEEFDPDFKSKTQVKKEMLDLQDLGRQLVKLPKTQRNQLPLDDSLQDAMLLADKIANKHEAFKRHIQYIGKLLREADLDAIQQKLDFFANKHQQETQRFHHLEALREQLINEGTPAIEALLSEHPAMERQKLRQLVRQASKEQAAEKPGKYFRELFQYIKSHNE